MLDDKGAGSLYLRDLQIERHDWFYAGMADVTWSQNSASNNADLYVGQDAPYDYGSSWDGRIAFYATGKFGDGWKLSARRWIIPATHWWTCSVFQEKPCA